MKHKQKIKLARKLRTKKDVKEHTPIFQTEAWFRRKEAIRLGVQKRIVKKPRPYHDRTVEKVERVV